jgi:hypothetical protein
MTTLTLKHRSYCYMQLALTFCQHDETWCFGCFEVRSQSEKWFPPVRQSTRKDCFGRPNFHEILYLSQGFYEKIINTGISDYYLRKFMLLRHYWYSFETVCPLGSTRGSVSSVRYKQRPKKELSMEHWPWSIVNGYISTVNEYQL